MNGVELNAEADQMQKVFSVCRIQSFVELLTCNHLSELFIFLFDMLLVISMKNLKKLSAGVVLLDNFSFIYWTALVGEKLFENS
ncbi:hypothetical protein IW492_13500 [Enterococcus sp. BWB1-3]|uniref:hypothetical protein n=1 Tax=unclassified Enterococcus TaxID=2608891 RepID=UPI001924A338|nr:MULTISPECIES: hypothetical protein [unclassified Enterococcus]MBL1230246.1 hypothetical protein [Enterococcus sp. BWB1-3]MCB5951110.1 hypothetical protein [Enterococcus sp. BWT-B8]MCB5955069.1 hypothetical protein [Enterococcus sp. CWB-B31]